jgi:acyl-CoA thioester hydrolase
MLPETPIFPVRVKRAVLWGEMDALGHVNNTVYLRWFEEARVQYSLHEKVASEAMLSVILAHQRIDYLAPVVYPDTVETRVSITRIGTSSMTMSFEIWSEVQVRMVAKGEGVMVAIEPGEGRARKLSEDAKQKVEAFEEER